MYAYILYLKFYKTQTCQLFSIQKFEVIKNCRAKQNKFFLSFYNHKFFTPPLFIGSGRFSLCI